MEIQTSKALSDVQQFRYELLQWCGNVEDAEKANTFVMGKDEKPVQAKLPKSGNMEDGIYLVHADAKQLCLNWSTLKTITWIAR